VAFIVYGVGAIGGTLAARLSLCGQEVRGIARGAQLAAIRDGGLLLRTPEGSHRVRFRCAATPAEAGIGPGDTILLTVKGQDTGDALDALVRAGVTTQPIVCMQNGVDNERQALRRFANVYGVTVMMPSAFLVPGEVACFGIPRAGIFDVGRYPSGTDSAVHSLVDVLDAAGFAAFAHERVMESKYAKLLQNLGNMLDAAAGAEGRARFGGVARAEGEAVLRAAGIAFGEVGPADPRRKALMKDAPIAGVDRIGSSSAQSLKRHAGSIETDALNGEIVLLGRLNGIPTPVNEWLCGLGRRMVRDGTEPGSVPIEDVAAALGPYVEGAH
jgi:2-dehydropantoate 2-reductase